MINLDHEEMTQHISGMMEFFALASERARELANNHGLPEEKVRDVLFMPSAALAAFRGLPGLYEAHLDEMEARIKGLTPPLFRGANRDYLLEPTRAEVLAACLVEFDAGEAQEKPEGPDTFDTFTVWMTYDVLDGYLEAELFEHEPEELFNDWEGRESEEKLRELEDHLVENHPREFFVDGRFFDIPEDRPVSEVSAEEMLR
jgi:hypothetical protein